MKHPAPVKCRAVWDVRFEVLDGVIDELKRQETARGHKKRK
jgi:hypothetical protein